MLLPFSLPEELPVAPEVLFPAAEELEVPVDAVGFEAEEAEPDADAYSYSQYAMSSFASSDCSPETRDGCTDSRVCGATRDRSTVKRHVREQSGTLVATLVVWVAGARLVAIVYVDDLRRLLVRAPAVLPLKNCIGEFALALVVAETECLVNVLS